jgi:hypothetical protein
VTQCRLKLPVEEDALGSKLALAFRRVDDSAIALSFAGEHRSVG